MPARFAKFASLLFFSLFVFGTALGQPVVVRYPEGSVHGYLALRSLDGKLVAAGDLTQTVRGNRLTSRLIYHFRDGSTDDETAVFTQSGHFRLLSDQHVQKGPAFKMPMDVIIHATTGEVLVRYTEGGKQITERSHIDLPADLANGILLDIAKNLSAEDGEVKLAYLAATPKPRVIHLTFKPDGVSEFRSAGLPNRAQRFKVHVELGGLEGVVAPIIGKQPEDSRVWVSVGLVPAFIRSENPLYLGGPLIAHRADQPSVAG